MAPPSEETWQSEEGVDYWVSMTCEIWNPSEITYIVNTFRLTDPQMEIELKEDYPANAHYMRVFSSMPFEIEPRVTEREIALTVTVKIYNNSIPPTGTYTAWVGINGEPELYGEPPFTYKSYKVILKQNRFGSTIKSEATPWNWGKSTSFKYRLVTVLLWAFSGGELLVMVYLLRKHRMKINKL